MKNETESEWIDDSLKIEDTYQIEKWIKRIDYDTIKEGKR